MRATEGRRTSDDGVRSRKAGTGKNAEIAALIILYVQVNASFTHFGLKDDAASLSRWNCSAKSSSGTGDGAHGNGRSGAGSSR